MMSSVLYMNAEAGSIAYGAATVGASSLNIRSGPNTTNAIVLTLSHSEIIVILEKTNAEWYHVVYNGTEGYVASMYLTNVLTAENFNASGKVTGSDVLMRSSPSTSGSKLGSYDAGTTVQVIGINNGWYKVKYNGVTGYIRSDFISIINSGSSTQSVSTVQQTSVAGTTDPELTLTSVAAEEETSQRQQLVDFALQYVGYNYVYGGSSPSYGFDCSGLVYYVFRHFNFNVSRTASSQYSTDGTSITKAELKIGDLVFFSSNGGYSITHVGIYIGNNKFVHASTPRIGVVISSLDSNYYTNVWYGAKRVLA